MIRNELEKEKEGRLRKGEGYMCGGEKQEKRKRKRKRKRKKEMKMYGWEWIERKEK